MLQKFSYKSFIVLHVSVYFLLNNSDYYCTARVVGSDDDAKEYLSKYGWISNEAIPDKMAEARSIQGALSEFQSFFGLRVTGRLDNATVTLMQTPRCGVPDKFQHNSIRNSRRRKRFAHQGSRWDKETLTYKLTKYMTKQSRPTLMPYQINQEIQKAFRMWEIHTNLNFLEATTDPAIDIDIKFESGDHGDGHAFRNPLVLAHAFFPAYGGDIHFNDDQEWKVDGSHGYDVKQVAAHEIGHSLGLEHSNVIGSIMYPTVIPNHNFQLHSDDILGIQGIYGVRATVEPQTTSTTTPVPTETPIPDVDNCPPNQNYDYLTPFYVHLLASSGSEFDIFNAPFEIQPITEIPWE